ncbi:carbamoyltransferase N-terminal domain-containing protein [uncultured Helicobacter sp.]|uniref:carbamoyltransferase N-terminal domain-containing protein n=1 Tax=uncultured Helicobacter sp. TaxID=175537 RepID=UPI00262386A9|nr:carbamoyltransferase N-terminal domain-containing protein [uncultured Helicobacter sp.]
MRILGISAYYHDSAIAVLENSDILFALQEERLSRVKADSTFPRDSIAKALAFLNSQVVSNANTGGGAKIIASNHLSKI